MKIRVIRNFFEESEAKNILRHRGEILDLPTKRAKALIKSGKARSLEAQKEITDPIPETEEK